MGVIDRIRSFFGGGSNSSGNIDMDGAMPSPDMSDGEEKPPEGAEGDSLEDDARSVQMGSMAARVQEQEAELKDTRERIQQFQKQLEEQRNEGPGTMQIEAPDDAYLKSKPTPVVSADGRFFGMFGGWISERDQIGIQCYDPHDRSSVQKVGWGDTLAELVMDPYNYRDRDVIICKLDNDMEYVEYMAPGQVQDLQKSYRKERDKAQRLSQENDRLIEQKREYSDALQKALMAVSMERMKNAEASKPEHAMEIQKLLRDNQLIDERHSNQSVKDRRRTKRLKKIIEDKEDKYDEAIATMKQSDLQNAIEETTEAGEGVVGLFSTILDAMTPEQQRLLLNSAASDGETVKIEESKNEDNNENGTEQ